TVSLQGDAVIDAGFERHHTTEVWNLVRRRVLTDRSALTELKVAVAAPRPDGAVAGQRETKIVAGRDGSHAAGQSGDLQRIRMRIEIQRPTAGAELAVEVYAPRPNGSVLFDCGRKLVAARRDRTHVR